MTASGKVVSCEVDRPNMNYITVVMLDSGKELTVRFPVMQKRGELVTVKV